MVQIAERYGYELYRKTSTERHEELFCGWSVSVVLQHFKLAEILLGTNIHRQRHAVRWHFGIQERRRFCNFISQSGGYPSLFY